MTTHTNGTVVGGKLQLDHPLDFPDHSRVKVSIEAEAADAFDWDAMMKLFERLRTQFPVHSGGRRFTREELHERR